tara:strand:+ start:592 stop:966 length:375 start_codon:yes stop_codon:yes gene_type:complete
MKYLLILITLITCICSHTYSQNNLQFNKVLLIDGVDIVPEGKIWKVSNVLSTLYSEGSSKILVNGIEIVVVFNFSEQLYIGNSNSVIKNQSYNGLSGSYWLPSNTTLEVGENVQFISVIEFNIE